ncbi:unnamed protein product [Adineta steineri]|uniref:Uncharacterized protein n=1 Tax=Adineta steineri TaxID=433720 RepID=A0A818YMW4_9BILA|nr:unnamed protein product [Adineta steineri]CAF3756577.1 unnamed protein product [Adineta steineri]
MGTRFRAQSEPLNQTGGSWIVRLTEIHDCNNDESSSKGAYETVFRENIHHNTTWMQNGFTIAGGNNGGNRLNQLRYPTGVYIDDDETVYIADRENNRIVECKCDSSDVRIAAGGNGQGIRNDQLNCPTSMIAFAKERNDLIICDENNKRLMRWSRQNNTSGQTIIANIFCSRLTMDNNGYFYVSDIDRQEVRRWKIGDTNGTLVAGGHGKGNRLNQLDFPMDTFVDEEHSVYVSDRNNNRVMKWMEGAKEGIVVAGGHGKGNADSGNHRVMRWMKGGTQASVVVGGRGSGSQANQLNAPFGLSFDRQGNLYVVDLKNHRVQRFNIDGIRKR